MNGEGENVGHIITLVYISWDLKAVALIYLSFK